MGVREYKNLTRWLLAVHGVLCCLETDVSWITIETAITKDYGTINSTLIPHQEMYSKQPEQTDWDNLAV